jgi:biopolymer transport protein ExbB/TolQ
MSPRLIAQLLSLLTSILVIAVLSRVLTPFWSGTLMDYGRSTWPFTIQNLQWFVFFSGLAELVVRWRELQLEKTQFNQGYLPEDEETVLKPGEDMTPIYQKVRNSPYRDVCFVPRLISRCVLGFNLSHSADQANSLLNSSLELFMHEIDLRYNMTRYITWLIPSIGFLGTVVGIMMALNYAGDRANVESPDMLYQVTERLGVAFATTFLALVQAAIVVFIQSLIQGGEERALNRAGQYCLDNLINRLYSSS